jgi:hypothetical protein
MCKEHHREYTREHYKANKVAYVDKAKRHRNSNSELVKEVKSIPCMDCGVKYPYYIMDLDHREDKSFDISSHRSKGRLQILAEIAKCDVVCANCHRIRTHDRMSGILIP